MSKQKTYTPSIWGLIGYGWDKLTGLTELPEQEATIRDLGGHPDMSNKTHAGRNKDYFHPIWGADERWKSSISNGTNPFVGIGRTIVPAVLGGAAATYAPLIIAAGVRAVPHIAKTVISNPVASAKTAGKGALTLGKSLIKGIIGGKAVDMGTKTFTDKNWGEFIAPYLGVSKDLADWTNPGYLLGGKDWGITKNVKRLKTYNKLNSKLELDLKGLNEQESLIKTLRNILDDEIRTILTLRLLANNRAYQAGRDVFNAKNLVDKYNPLLEGTLTYRIVRHRHNKFVTSDTPDLNGTRVTMDLDPIKTSLKGETSGFTDNVTFTAPNGTVSSSPVTVLQKAPGNIEIARLPFNFQIKDGKLEPLNEMVNITGGNGSRFGSMMEGDTGQLQKGISDYVDSLEGIMGEDGTVAGSLIHYKNGVLKGTLVDSNLIGPADTEIYTTRARLPKVQEKLLFRVNRTNSTGGSKGTSPYTFRNTDPTHNNVDTEINIIEADPQGNATGKIAHQIYRALWPEKYSKMLYDSVMSGSKIPSSNLSLPISAEELLQHLKKNPEAMQLHLLVDMLGMETFTKPQNAKASKRLFSVLFNPDNGTPLRLANALQAHGKYNLGSHFKLGTDLYPNLSFADIKANKLFLLKAFKLSEDEATRVASNPELMKNAFNLYNFSVSTGVRVLNSDVTSGLAENGQLLRNPIIEMFTGNGAFSGGQWSGSGLNLVPLNPFGGWRNAGMGRDIAAISLRPVTYFPLNIKTPADLVTQVERLKTLPDTGYEALELAGNVHDHSVPFKYDLKRMLEIRNLSKQNDLPFILRPGLFDFYYQGGLAEPISAGTRYITTEDHHELGSLLRDIMHSEGSGEEKSMMLKNAPAEINEIIRNLALNGLKHIDRFNNIWKILSYKDRGSILKQGSLGVSGSNPYAIFHLLETTPREAKRTLKAYNYNAPPLKAVGFSDIVDTSNAGILRLISQLTRKLNASRIPENTEYPEFYEDILRALSEVSQADSELLSKYNRLYTDYTKFYKGLRRALYEALLTLAKYTRLGKLYRKQADHIYDTEFPKLNKELSLLAGQQQKVRLGLWRTQYKIRDAKLGLKDRFTIGTIAGGLGSLIYGATLYNRHLSREDKIHSWRERQGLEDPDNGYYEYEMYERDLDSDLIRENLKKAKELYNKRKNGNISKERK